MPKANVEGACEGDAQGFESREKMVREGGEEPERTAVSAHPHVACRPASAVIDIGEGEPPAETRPHNREGQVLVETPLSHVAKRHHLNKREIHPASVRPLDECRELVLVDALQGDPSYFHLEPGC